MRTIYCSRFMRRGIFLFVVISCTTIYSVSALPEPYCFSKEGYFFHGKTDEEKEWQKNQIYARRFTPSFFGVLLQKNCGNVIALEEQGLISQDILQMYRRLGIITQWWEVKARLQICLVAYVQNFSKSDLSFPGDWCIARRNPFPLVFFGKSISLQKPWDAIEEGETAGLHVRSLPFGIKLFSSTKPKIFFEKDITTAYCFIPPFILDNSGQPTVMQTVFWRNLKDKLRQNNTLSTEDFVRFVQNIPHENRDSEESRLLCAIKARIKVMLPESLNSEISSQLKKTLESIENFFAAEMSRLEIMIDSVTREDTLIKDALLQTVETEITPMLNALIHLHAQLDDDTTGEDRISLNHIFRIYQVDLKLKRIFNNKQLQNLSGESLRGILGRLKEIWEQICGQISTIRGNDDSHDSRRPESHERTYAHDNRAGRPCGRPVN